MGILLSTFTIETFGLSDKSVYIRSAALNGRKLDHLRVRFADVVNGGKLIIEAGTIPADR